MPESIEKHFIIGFNRPSRSNGNEISLFYQRSDTTTAMAELVQRVVLSVNLHSGKNELAKTLCYSHGRIHKNKQQIYVRFIFDCSACV